MSKEYEKIRQEVHKKYKSQITELKDENKKLEDALISQISKTETLQKENEKLKAEYAKLLFLSGKTKEEVDALEVHSSLQKGVMSLMNDLTGLGGWS